VKLHWRRDNGNTACNLPHTGMFSVSEYAFRLTLVDMPTRVCSRCARAYGPVVAKICSECHCYLANVGTLCAKCAERHEADEMQDELAERRMRAGFDNLVKMVWEITP